MYKAGRLKLVSGLVILMLLYYGLFGFFSPHKFGVFCTSVLVSKSNLFRTYVDYSLETVLTLLLQNF